MNSHPRRDWLYHNVPNWITRSCYPYFVTVCLQQRNIESLIHEDRAKFLYESLEYRSLNGFLYLNLVVVMPDHLHMILQFPEYGAKISKIIGDWKAWTSKSREIRWQKGFFEHRLRNDREWEEKDAFCRMNPVRAGFLLMPMTGRLLGRKGILNLNKRTAEAVSPYLQYPCHRFSVPRVTPS